MTIKPPLPIEMFICGGKLLRLSPKTLFDHLRKLCDIISFRINCKDHWASLVAQLVTNLPAMQKIWLRSLDWEDPLEKGKATHSSILAWKIPQTEEPGRLQSMGSRRVRQD